MLLPCAPLDPLLLWRVLASIVASPLRGTGVVVVPVLPLLLLLGVLLVVVLLLPLLLGMLLLVMLRLLLVTLGLLLPLLTLRLGMLLFGFALLMPALLLFGVVLLVAVLFVLGVGRCSDSEKQGQNGRAGNCDHFHMCCLRCGWITFALLQASGLRIDRIADGLAGHEKLDSAILLPAGGVVV